VEQITIIITESAYTDLEDIELYISQDSPLIARQFVNRIFGKIDQLYLYPRSGKIVPEIKRDDIRELLLNKYRIIYQTADKSIINILRIVHGSRLLDIEI
jgi:plasmid stabilization system protein ParE